MPGPGLTSQTKLLLHCWGADESTTFTDVSSKGKTIVTGADAQVDTTLADPWGTNNAGVMQLDGTGDHVYVDMITPSDPDEDYAFFVDSAPINYQTIDFWVYHNNAGTAEYYVSRWQSASYIFTLYKDANDKLGIYLRINGTNRINYVCPTATLSADAWHHVIFHKKDNLTYGIYLDGNQVGYITTAQNSNIQGDIYLGCYYSGSTSYYVNGYMSEFRWQHNTVDSNYFNLSPVEGLTDTYTLPTTNYSSIDVLSSTLTLYSPTIVVTEAGSNLGVTSTLEESSVVIENYNYNILDITELSVLMSLEAPTIIRLNHQGPWIKQPKESESWIKINRKVEPSGSGWGSSEWGNDGWGEASSGGWGDGEWGDSQWGGGGVGVRWVKHTKATESWTKKARV